MGYTTAAFAIASLAATAVGTGLSFYGQQQQASNAAALANYNAQIAEQNNRINLAMARQQSQWQEQIALSRSRAAQNNAIALEQQGRAAEAQAREEARRMREENQRRLATQRSKYAKAGVTSEGSPLAIMAESAALMELGVQDVHYKGNLEGMKFDRMAELQRYEGQFGLFDAAVARYEGAAAEAGFRIQQNAAGVNRMAGMATSAGYRSAAASTLISGAGQAINISGQYFS